MHRSISLLIILCMALPGLAQEIYTYLDDEGTLHFTDQPKQGWTRVRFENGEVIRPKTRTALTIAYVGANIPYSELINAASSRYGLDGNLISAVIAVESSYNPQAVSSARAKGLMQLMDATASDYGVRDVFDPAENINAGSRHLRNLLDAYEGDLTLALAAYNAGQGAVARHGGVPPYKETRRYIEKIAARYTVISPKISDEELAKSYIAARAIGNGQRYIYRYETRNGYAYSEVIPQGRAYRRIDLLK